MRLDRATILIFGMVASVIYPSVALWQRQTTIERSQAVIAQEQVAHSLAACKVLNDVPAAILTAEAPRSPVGLSDRDRLVLRSYLESAIEVVEHPKTCTVASLHLEKLAELADRP